ncbi:MAG: TonB family protein [Caulobacteraceae bacterium]
MLAVSLASSAWAQPTAPPPESGASASAQDPTFAFYPPAALKARMAGSATVVCKRSYKDCSVEAEGPSGEGFGATAVAIVRKAYADCNLREGGKTQFAFTFKPSGPTVTPDLLSPARLENPHWLPTARFVWAYPDRAARKGVGGSALLDCLVRDDGRLTCDLISETPHGYDFGKAAVAMATLFRVSPRSCSGEPAVGRWLDVPINFKPPPR